MEVYFKNASDLVKELTENEFTSEENRIVTSANVVYLITNNEELICDIAINNDGTAYLRGNGGKMNDEITKKLTDILVKYMVPEKDKINT